MLSQLATTTAARLEIKLDPNKLLAMCGACVCRAVYLKNVNSIRYCLLAMRARCALCVCAGDLLGSLVFRRDIIHIHVKH